MSIYYYLPYEGHIARRSVGRSFVIIIIIHNKYADIVISDCPGDCGYAHVIVHAQV